jgi:RNA polymerase sigma-70 factor (ECF subfamily)
VIPAATRSLNTTLLADRMEPAVPPPAVRVLTAGLARGDDGAWAEFHRVHGPGLFRWLLACTHGDHDLAGEALQQTYLRVARHARSCDSEGQFAAWLRIVGRSALIDCRRRRRSFLDLLKRRSETPPTDDLTDEAAAERLHRFLDVALTRLTPDDRALLEAKYLAGREVRSLAADLGVTAKAVESRLTRARAALRAHLQPFLADHE